MDVRIFQETDTDAVVALWRECGLVKPWNDPHRDIARKLPVNRELFLVGLVDGKPVASVMGGYDGHRGWINYLAVTPSQRHQGFGRKMMQAVEARISALGCPKINLQIRMTNRDAIAFYERLGYRNDDVIGLGKRIESDES